VTKFAQYIPEFSSVKTVNLVEKFCYSYGDKEFVLIDGFYWCTL